MLPGIVFGVIVILWIAYLMPFFLGKRHVKSFKSVEQTNKFADSMNIIFEAEQLSKELVPQTRYKVSTPLMRRAGRYNLRQSQRMAVARRRKGLIFHLLLLVSGIVVPFFTPVSHLWTLVPVALLVNWVVISRISVITISRMVHQREAALDISDDEETVAIVIDGLEDLNTESIDISGDLSNSLFSLADPITPTPRTYVSQPQLPRSVRTVDLSAPLASSDLVMPTASDNATVNEVQRAVGE